MCEHVIKGQPFEERFHFGPRPFGGLELIFFHFYFSYLYGATYLPKSGLFNWQPVRGQHAASGQ